MHYIPVSEKDRELMLKSIGVSSFDDLIDCIPEKIRLKTPLNLPKPVSEIELKRILRNIASRNLSCEDAICFLGGGAYDHFIPSVIGEIISRSEFLTAYTPYQAEVSQGTLQAIYEYQTMICELTGMDVSNASLYDGASALGEAALMALSQTGRNLILVAKGLNPNYREVIRSYCQGHAVKIMEIPIVNGQVDLEVLDSRCDNETAAFIFQNPNFFGIIEDGESIAEIVKKNGALLVVSVDPISLALIEPPGEYGADIVTGEGQSLGVPLNFGGPYLGIFATRSEFVRKMPGRIVGMTQDVKGDRGFVLTLQTREQHIRREKATSNICTNEGLVMLSAAIYLELVGRVGLHKIASLCLHKSHHLSNLICDLPGYELLFSSPFFKEFAVSAPVKGEQLIRSLEKKNIFPGIDLAQFDYGVEKGILIAVTEKRTREEMEALVEELSKF